MMLLVSGATVVFRPLVHARPDIYGQFVTPADGNSLYELGKWAADNGCYAKPGEPSPFSPDRFRAMLQRHQYARDRCLFVAVPDVVADARKTMCLFWEWEPQVREYGYRCALVAQDGLDVDDSTRIPWRMVDAIFIGGSVGWKLSASAAHLIEAARLRGKWIHMGKVNTARRLRYAAALGVDSVDGSGWSKWSRAMTERHGVLLRSLSEQRRLLLHSHPHWRAVMP
jgi:hypothetical protein